MQLKIAAFIIVTAGIVVLSRPYFRKLRSYGFWRFFAFESILLLVLHNVDVWFHLPFSPLQVLSWILLIASTIVAIHGFHLLHTIGRPAGHIENTTVLVRRGAYKFIRHPLYSSLLFGALAVFFKNPSLVPGGMFIAAVVFLVVTAKAEEAENLRKFGEEYATYRKHTKMFLPYVF